MKEEEKQRLKSFGYMTVAELKKQLEQADDNSLVLYQRIEDVYFDYHNWRTYPMLYEDDESSYVPAFSAYEIEKEGVFVLNAHY